MAFPYFRFLTTKAWFTFSTIYKRFVGRQSEIERAPPRRLSISLSILISSVLHIDSTVIRGMHSGLFGDSIVTEFPIPSQEEGMEGGVRTWIGYIRLRIY
jgi:hypothetical protein